jgi:hypothetical protein
MRRIVGGCHWKSAERVFLAIRTVVCDNSCDFDGSLALRMNPWHSTTEPLFISVRWLYTARNETLENS